MMKGRAHYAVEGGRGDLTRSLANEWAEDGIRVIAVAPGYVKTPMIQRSIEAGELDERKLAAMHPLNRLATTQEIAAAMIALAQPPFLFMTGAVVVAISMVMPSAASWRSTSTTSAARPGSSARSARRTRSAPSAPARAMTPHRRTDWPSALNAALRSSSRRARARRTISAP